MGKEHPAFVQNGGAWVYGAEVKVFGLKWPGPAFGGTWPVGQIACYADRIVVRARPFLTVALSISDIDEVTVNRNLWPKLLWGDQFKIVYHSNESSRVEFYARRIDQLVEHLREMGLVVSEIPPYSSR